MKLLLALLSWALVSFVQGKIVSETPSSAQYVRFHYRDDAETSCLSSLIIVGVGTAMRVTDYDGVGRAIAEELRDSIVIIIDSLQGIPIKLFPYFFAGKVNNLVAQLLQDSSEHENNRTMLPSHVHLCSTTAASNQLRVVVGGHSASGEAAFYAFALKLYSNDFSLAGFFGLDPFPIVSFIGVRLSIPALYWGFSSTTCGVLVSQAALSAYNKSPPGLRALYQLKNDDNSKQCFFSHCCFTDAGCPGCPLQCNLGTMGDLHHDVGVSVQLFVNAITAGQGFSRQQFETTDFRLNQDDVLLYVDNTTIEEDNTVEATARRAKVGAEL
jgi:hypothetical protein